MNTAVSTLCNGWASIGQNRFCQTASHLGYATGLGVAAVGCYVDTLDKGDGQNRGTQILGLGCLIMGTSLLLMGANLLAKAKAIQVTEPVIRVSLSCCLFHRITRHTVCGMHFIGIGVVLTTGAFHRKEYVPPRQDKELWSVALLTCPGILHLLLNSSIASCNYLQRKVSLPGKFPYTVFLVEN